MALRTALLSLTSLLGLCVSLSGAPVMSLGDNTSLIWRVEGAVQHNDNIFLDSQDEESDTIWVFSPGFELSVGQQPSNANIDIVYVHDFVTYGDNNRLNRDNPDARLTGYYQTAKSRIDYGGSYKVNNQNDASSNVVGDLATRDLTRVYVNGEWGLTEKSSITTGYYWNDVDYEQARFHDRDSYSIPINYYWEATPKVDMSVGYRFRNTSFSRGRSYIQEFPDDPLNERPDFDDQFFNVGIRGEIGAKTTAEIKIGIQDRDFNRPGIKDADLFSADARINWAATEKSSLSIQYSRDFDADAFGQSIERSDIQIAGQTELSEEFIGFASIRFSDDDYFGARSDDGVYGQVGVTYTPNMYSAVSLAYLIYNNSSDFEPADFENNIVNLSGTLRF